MIIKRQFIPRPEGRGLLAHAMIKEEIHNPLDNLGRDIKIWGLQCDALEGKLLAADEYDLVLETSSPLPQDCRWAIPSAGNNIIVNRSGLVLMAAK